MEKVGKMGIVFAAGLLAGWWLAATPATTAGTGEDSLPQGVYLKLTQDFYEALQAPEARVYTNDPAKAHLREIAVNTRFMVEVNLQILKEQERLAGLLATGR